MKTGVRIQGVDSMLKRLRQHPQLIAREAESVVIQEARGLCVEYGRATVPGPGFDAGKDEQFRKRVGSDIGRVFASRSKPAQVMALMKVHAPELAKAYWHAYKAGKERQMSALVRKANLPQGLNPADHRAARTGKQGRVRKMDAPISLATETQLAAYVRRKKALVGFAKAGWYAAAKSLGGRVRRRIVTDSGKRSTEEIFPAHIRKLAQRFPAAGGSRTRGAGMNFQCEVFTRVNHAVEAMPEALYQNATSRAREKLGAAMAQAVAAINRKLFKAA